MLFYTTFYDDYGTGRVYKVNIDGYDKKQIATLKYSLDANIGLSVDNNNTICWANTGRCRYNIISLKLVK